MKHEYFLDIYLYIYSNISMPPLEDDWHEIKFKSSEQGSLINFLALNKEVLFDIYF